MSIETPTSDNLRDLFDLGSREAPTLDDARQRLRDLPASPDGSLVQAVLVDWARALAGSDRLARTAARHDAIQALKQRKVAGPACVVDAALTMIEEAPAAPPAASSRDELLAAYDEETAHRLAAMPGEVRADAESVLAHPRLIDYVLADIEAVGVAGEQDLAAAIYLIGTSRLLDTPNAGIVQGLSSTGKSYVVAGVAKLFPDETVLRATDQTANSFYYLPPGRLLHRFVVAGERSRKEDDDRAEATRALREMLEGGELRKLVPVKLDGQIVTREIHQPGPIAYVETTTLHKIFDEDMNRAVLLNTDESKAQTERVLHAMADAAAGLSRNRNKAAIRARHHAIQRLLRRVHVEIPFSQQVIEATPKDRPEARRAAKHLLNMIRTVALLHQRQRANGPLAHGDTIQATDTDYVIAARLMRRPLGRSLGRDISPATLNAVKRWRSLFGDAPFTCREILDRDPAASAKQTINRHLNEAAKGGLAELVAAHHGTKPAVWRLLDAQQSLGAAWLPRPSKLEARS